MRSINYALTLISSLFVLTSMTASADDCSDMLDSTKVIESLSTDTSINNDLKTEIINTIFDYRALCIDKNRPLPLWDENTNPYALLEKEFRYSGKNNVEIDKAFRARLKYATEVLDQFYKHLGSQEVIRRLSSIDDPRDKLRNDLLEAKKGIVDGRFSITTLLRPTAWDITKGSNIRLGIGSPDLRQHDLYTKYIGRDCGINGTVTACRSTYSQVMELIEIASTTQWLMQQLNEKELVDVIADLRLLKERWAYYTTTARTLYYWELVTAVNTMKKNDPDGYDGFYEPPTMQHFWLHPTATYEYVDDASSTESLEGSVTLEWYGQNHWDWKNASSSEAKYALGWSVISTYSKRANVDDWGHGLMLHVNHKYSFGLTYREEGDVGISVNINLATLFDKWNNKKLDEILPASWLEN